MKKSLFYIILLFLVLVSCEDIYNPEIFDSNQILVVQARLTNSPEFNYIRLYYTNPYTSDSAYNGVTNANIQLYSKSNVYKLPHSGDGVYKFPYPLEVGEKYKLRITHNNEIYESEWEQLPPLPSIHKLYVEPVTIDSYHTNNSGEPIKVSTNHVQIAVDLPVNENSKYYFFRTRSIVLISFQNDFGGITYGCLSFFNPEANNFTGPANHSENPLILKFPVSCPKTDFKYYIDYSICPDDTGGYGWIFEIDQYGITENCYKFYSNMAEQLNAEGKLFDPINTQITGNLQCISNPNLTILGCFELCSVKRHQYFTYKMNYKQPYFHKIEPNINIPLKYFGNRPKFWQYEK